MKISEMKIRQIIREELKGEPLQLDANTQIFCDMDGVLVDFAVGAIELANSIISGVYGAEFVQKSKSMRRALRDIEPGFKVQTSSDLDIPEVRSLMFAAIGFNALFYRWVDQSFCCFHIRTSNYFGHCFKFKIYNLKVDQK